jgi:glycosyltransferase involved in cell wall biosynthesis
MGPAGRVSILYVGSLPPARHGVAVMCGQLLAGLAAVGHRVRAITPVEGQVPSQGDQFIAALQGVEVIGLPVAEVAFDHGWASDTYRALIGDGLRRIVDAQVAVERPDIILMGSTSMAEHLPRLAAPHALPSVVILHTGNVDAMLKGALPGGLHQSQRLLAGFRHADQLVAVAPHVGESARGLGIERVLVIENPVDVHRFAPRPKDHDLMKKLGIEPDALVVAHVSNLWPLKRPLDVVLAAERALSVEPRVLGLILGDGPLREQMEMAVAERGIGGRFRFAGWLDHAAIPRYLSLADVVVMASEFEGRSLVSLETQACGRVLLASDIPSAREVVVDGKTGLLFRTGDVAHLAARLLDILGDARLRETIVRQARRAAERYALEDVVAAYEALFRDIISRRSPEAGAMATYHDS